MELSVEIYHVKDDTLKVIDNTRETDQYIPEETQEPLPKYDAYKYSQSCTINIVRYNATGEYKVEDSFISLHGEEEDSVVIHFEYNGYYTLCHIVLPTLDWLEAVKDLDLSYYQIIYVTDGEKIYKYKRDSQTLEEVDPQEVMEVNPEGTTIQGKAYNIFNLDALERCYIKASMNVMNSYTGRCAKVDDTIRFNRDFLWMTLNVIKYHLQRGKYAYAQMILENLKCYNFCSDLGQLKTKVPCGCSK